MHRHGCYPWFTFAGAAAVALDDAEVFRKTLRRMCMLDRLSVFDEDVALQERVEELLARKFAEGPPRQGRQDRTRTHRYGTRGSEERHQLVSSI